MVTVLSGGSEKKSQNPLSLISTKTVPCFVGIPTRLRWASSSSPRRQTLTAVPMQQTRPAATRCHVAAWAEAGPRRQMPHFVPLFWALPRAQEGGVVTSADRTPPQSPVSRAMGPEEEAQSVACWFRCSHTLREALSQHLLAVRPTRTTAWPPKCGSARRQHAEHSGYEGQGPRGKSGLPPPCFGRDTRARLTSAAPGLGSGRQPTKANRRLCDFIFLS